MSHCLAHHVLGGHALGFCEAQQEMTCVVVAAIQCYLE